MIRLVTHSHGVLIILLFATLSHDARAEPIPNGVQKFLVRYCVECHNATSAEGGIRWDEDGNRSRVASSTGNWEKAYHQLTLKQMPPEDAEQPTREERLAITKWLANELAASGVELQNKLELPGYGNYVPHELLFGNQEVGPSFSEPRLWRIRPQVYLGIMNDVSRDELTLPFTLSSSGIGFRDYSKRYALTGPDLNQLIINAQKIAESLTQTQSKSDTGEIIRGKRTPKEFFDLIYPEDAAITSYQMDAAISWLYQRTALDKPTEQEMARLADFAEQSIQSDGKLLGVRNLIAAILLSPDVLYRHELGGGEKDEFGRVRLSPREIAFAIALTLTDAPPDQLLMKAVEQGQLETRQEAQTQIKRLLEDKDRTHPRVLEFFREYFEYSGAADVFKDKELFPSHSPVALVHDTDFLVLHLYENDKDVLKELLTTPKSFVQFQLSKGLPKKSAAQGVGAHVAYNLPPDWKWIPEQPIELPGEQRAGVLTQPSWLVAMSDNFDNHAIRRGLWIRRKLLGGTVPDLPISVDAQLPEDHTKTLRERMQVTQDSYCWKCHQQMNDLGLPFEMYDHFGRWRTEELGKPVNATGIVDHIKASDIEGEVNGGVNLLHKLAESGLARQVFVRHNFRFWMGRNETMHDAATLREVDRAYVESGGSMKAMIVSLLSSDSFLYRKSIDSNQGDKP
ncbi:DUF1588 domain-containing protein [Bremerella sp.]|uniref:DUF1588 domain-containing protein n=1 Tax=Bremerella sp. TaxID=2795602 RepID=UPI003918BF58